MLQPHERKRLAEIHQRNQIDQPGGIDVAWLLAIVESLDLDVDRLTNLLDVCAENFNSLQS